METAQTWESEIAAAEGQPPPSGETNPPVAENTAPPAEQSTTPDPAPTETASTQTTEASETSAAPAREAESDAVQPTEKPDDDIQEEDTEEVKALPTASARKWARRRDRDAQLSDKYLGTEAISVVADDLYKRSPSRYSELAMDIIQSTFGMPYDQLKAKLDAPPEATSQIDPLSVSPDYDPLTDEAIPETVKAQLREAAGLRQQVQELGGKVSTIEQTEAQRAAEARQVQVGQIETELKTSVLSVVPEAIKSYGLEVSDKDPPILAGAKKALSRQLQTEFDGYFAKSPDNMKAIERARYYAERLERDNVFREEDGLKVRVRASLDQAYASEEAKAIVELMKFYVDTQAKQIASRGLNTPQTPASSASAPLSNQGELTGSISDMWDQQIARSKVA